MSSLSDQLAALPTELQELLGRHGFDRERFVALAERAARGPADNRVRGTVEPPAAGDVSELPAAGSAEWERWSTLGRQALARGECALVVLAGGMATRMGGVVKALVEAVPGHRFLDLRLNEMDALEKRVGRRAPLWLMTSHATEAGIREALGAKLAGDALATFNQHLSLRITPDGKLFLGEDGRPSAHAPGHGDLPDALRASGLLERFVARGGKSVMVANLDNLGATLDETLLGFHLAHGQPVTCEVVDKLGSDRGGIPVRWNGRPVVLEEFRLPSGFDPNQVRVFNTNTFTFDARALLELAMDWTFFVVQKQVDGKAVLQFERLIGEVTSVLATRFVRVPRAGAQSRFLPVKDNEDLAQRGAEITRVARARGMLPAG
jgi:UTP--glucose-1-phosphate uridylyltransferase